MSRVDLTLMTAVLITAVGAVAFLFVGDLIRRIIALNVASGGVMMLLLGLAYRADPAAPDPVPQALVLTGIVVMVAVTGLALTLARRVEEPEAGDSAADAGDSDADAGAAVDLRDDG